MILSVRFSRYPLWGGSPSRVLFCLPRWLSPRRLLGGSKLGLLLPGHRAPLLSGSVQHCLPSFPTLALPSFSVSNLAFLSFFQLNFTFKMSHCYFHLFIKWSEFKDDVHGMLSLPLSFDSIPDRAHGSLVTFSHKNIHIFNN